MPGALAKALQAENHSHMVYLAMQGVGLMSPAKDGHTHEVYYDIQIDEATGQPLSEGNWVIAEAEGHIHELGSPIFVSKRRKKMGDDERVARVHALFKEADGIEGESVTDGESSYSYYIGPGQWPSDAKARLNADQRAALTINEIKPKVDLLVGHQAQNRSDIHVKPVENGDERVADVLTMLIKHVMDKSDYIYEETTSFRDSVVAGRGVFNIKIDYDRTSEGEICVEHFPWSKVRFGPHERLDQSDMEYLVKFDRFSLSKLKQLFPDRASELQSYMETFIEDSGSGHRYPGRQYELGQGKSQQVTINSTALVDSMKKDFAVFECWEKEFKRVKIALFPQDDFAESLADMNRKDAAMVRMIPGFRVIERVRHDMRVTKVAGGVFLETEVLELPENANDFHLVTTYATKHGSRFQGKVEDVKDLQSEINKRHSQAMDAVNKMSAYGWFVGPDTFLDEGGADSFRRNSAKAGFVQMIQDIARPPVKIEGGKFPNEIISMEEISSRKLNEIMGIPPEAAGFGAADASGKAMLIRRRQSLVSNDYLFDNLSRAKRKLGRMIIAYIQDFYTPARMARIVGGISNPGVQVNTNVVDLGPEEIERIMKDVDLAQYDIVVEESSHTKTMKDLSFLQLMELAHQGVPGLEDSIIESGPFVNKGKILQRLGMQRESAAAAENQKNQTELLKSAPDEIKNAVYGQMFGMQQGAPAEGQQPQGQDIYNY